MKRLTIVFLFCASFPVAQVDHEGLHLTIGGQDILLDLQRRQIVSPIRIIVEEKSCGMLLVEPQHPLASSLQISVGGMQLAFKRNIPAPDNQTLSKTLREIWQVRKPYFPQRIHSNGWVFFQRSSDVFCLSDRPPENVNMFVSVAPFQGNKSIEK